MSTKDKVKEFMNKILDQYLEITDGYWSIEISQRNGKYVYSIYKGAGFLMYEEPIEENT